ncbi:MAG TPA: hypothetical protein VD813_00720 [Pseudonocardia sp.]|nr:hypothetical protein [Pseudonocardia sp.]
MQRDHAARALFALALGLLIAGLGFAAGRGTSAPAAPAGPPSGHAELVAQHVPAPAAARAGQPGQPGPAEPATLLTAVACRPEAPAGARPTGTTAAVPCGAEAPARPVRAPPAVVS